MPERNMAATAYDTVGALMPECRVNSARDAGPRA
jgi:hypothetical protein